MKHARVLTIQDYSSIGRCSLTAALPILSACGQDPVGLPTALLSTQTAGITGFTFNDLYANMMPSYNHWMSLGIKFDCLYTGFIGTMDTVNATIEIAKGLKAQGTIIAIDPACAEHGKLYSIFDEAYKNKIFDLCKMADIVMPNFTEGKMLAGLEMELDFSDEAVSAIADAGFDPVYGARPLRRAIQQRIEDKLSEQMLEGKLKSGKKYYCDYKEECV